MDRQYSSSSSDDEMEQDRRHKRIEPQEVKMWDIFDDPPRKKTTGSAEVTNCMDIFLKITKIVTYLLVLSAVLIGASVTKVSVVFMTSQLSGSVTKYCNETDKQSTTYRSIVSNDEQIAWTWALIFAFAFPELWTFLRAARICFFKNFLIPGVKEQCLICTFEMLHVLGLAIMVFQVFPEIGALQSILITNCICVIPAVLGLMNSVWKKKIWTIIDVLAIAIQLSVFIVNMQWYVPLSMVLISARWWENYALENRFFRFSKIMSNMKITTSKKDFIGSRYFVYLYLSPLKAIAFALLAFGIRGYYTVQPDYPEYVQQTQKDITFDKYFTNFKNGWTNHTIPVWTQMVADEFHSQDAVEEVLFIDSTTYVVCYTMLIQIGCAFATYLVARFACKIQIQSVSFSLPLVLVVPASFATVMSLAWGRTDNGGRNLCVYENYLPNYLFFDKAEDFDWKDSLIIYYWIAWFISFGWITRHIWFPKCISNASTDALFVAPVYNGLLLDQSLLLNRRREYAIKDTEQKSHMDEEQGEGDESYIKKTNTDVQLKDRIPQVFVCATMWHETEDEIMEFLKSILRLDEDQSSRRLAMMYIQCDRKDIDNEYYDLETHIFFDDAFIEKEKCEDPDGMPLNSYVKTLINCIEPAAREVYQVKMRIRPPSRTVTPYGGRLVWKLPGNTKIIAHLKHKDKIRKKKRWSQVMYMYYLLGYRIMQSDKSIDRKKEIAQNTYLLALDGDIDFQPNAVQLLLSRMKVDPDLGAACGRIHPVGSGPMVWYQTFEYAIGHWLQKATEHIIGCVLCSPGCFSLFRGSALMENSVMKKYTTQSKEALHYVQYDQGEDRWLCTLLLKQKFRVEYSAASDAYTHAPEGFNEFYNQRRRWVPSTMANIIDLLLDSKQIVKSNSSISMIYIAYQFLLLVGTVLGPGTIFLMMVGALVTVFRIDIWTSFLWNFLPLLFFMILCYLAKQKYQLMVAFFITAVYALVMMAVVVGIIIQITEDSILSPSSLFFVAVAGQICITAFLHPLEFGALKHGVVYYVTIPSMYMLLIIYSLFNMHDVSWGTRENPQPAAVAKEATTEKEQSKTQRLMSFFGGKNGQKEEEDGGVDFSLGGLFRCMMFTHPRDKTPLIHISDQLQQISKRLHDMERRLAGDVVEMPANVVDVVSPTPTKDFEPLDEAEKMQMTMLPDWLLDDDVKNGDIDTLTTSETKFWNDLIDSYLKPIDLTDEDKENMKKALQGLRDMVVMAFFMINALFVVVIFLFQLNKEQIHLKWPLEAKNYISYDDTTMEITIVREYLELEPLGFVFVLFFGVVICIQFISMLKHRLVTVSEILSTVKLELCSKDTEQISSESDLLGQAPKIAKILQKPKVDFDEDEEMKIPIGRRDTVRKLITQQKNKLDWSNLEVNFRRKFFADGEIADLGRISLRRETVKLLNKRRESMIDARNKRKSMRQSQVANGGQVMAIHHDGVEESMVDNWDNSFDNRIQERRLENPNLGIDNKAYEDDEEIELHVMPRKSAVTFKPSDYLD